MDWTDCFITIIVLVTFTNAENELIQLAKRPGEGPDSGRLEARASSDGPFRVVCSLDKNLNPTDAIPVAACRDLGYRNVSKVVLGNRNWQPTVQVAADWIQFDPTTCPDKNFINSLWECSSGLPVSALGCTKNRRWIWLECADKIEAEPDASLITCSSMLTETKVTEEDSFTWLLGGPSSSSNCALDIKAENSKLVVLLNTAGWRYPNSPNCSDVPRIVVSQRWSDNDSIVQEKEWNICDGQLLYGFDMESKYLHMEFQSDLDSDLVAANVTISAVTRVSCDTSTFNLTIPESDFLPPHPDVYHVAAVGPSGECPVELMNSNVLTKSFRLNECNSVFNTSITEDAFGYQNILTITVVTPYADPDSVVESVEIKRIPIECRFSEWLVTSNNFTLI